MAARPDLAPAQRGAPGPEGTRGRDHLSLVPSPARKVIVGAVGPDPRGLTGPFPGQRGLFEKQLAGIAPLGLTKPAGLVIREAADNSGRLHPVYYFKVPHGREKEVAAMITPGQVNKGEAVLIDGATVGLAPGPVEDPALINTIFTERVAAFSGRKSESDTRK